MTNATADATAIQTIWPERFPAHKDGFAGFAVREVQADPDAVFAWIRRVDLHEQYYPALRFVRKRGGAWPVVEKGSAFAMLIGGLYIPYVKLTQVDTELRALGWGSNTPLLSVCHAFTVKSVGDGRTLIRSEERAVGPLAKVLKPIAGGQLQKIQTDWADALVKMVNQHPDGPPSA